MVDSMDYERIGIARAELYVVLFKLFIPFLISIFILGVIFYLYFYLFEGTIVVSSLILSFHIPFSVA